jgi:hypothetical protein
MAHALLLLMPRQQVGAVERPIATGALKLRFSVAKLVSPGGRAVVSMEIRGDGISATPAVSGGLYSLSP